MQENDGRHFMVNTSRLNARRLLMILMFSLILPVLVCVVIDILFDLMPLLTIISSTICIPLASLLIIKITLSEFDRVIQDVAPEEPKIEPLS